MSGMTGASMLRTRRKDVNVKPNRKLDRKSSRGMLYENEELRLRTININAEVERGQSDIKKLKRENDQLKREISALRYEYDKLDHLLRERKSSPEHSDDSSCAECAASDGSKTVGFHDLSVVPEEVDESRSGVDSPCACEECQPDVKPQRPANNQRTTPAVFEAMTHPPDNTQIPNTINNERNRPVDVLVHDSLSESPVYYQAVTSQPYRSQPPPPPGFVMPPFQPTRFRTGGNIEDLLGDVQSSPSIQTTYIQQNSVFMCNTQRIMQKQCSCHQPETPVQNGDANTQKSYITEKNIELTYDYPRSNPIRAARPDQGKSTTTEVASTVVFVEKRVPVKPKRFDFFFRSRSAPVGENEEPIYATVKKLPKRLHRIELANLEREVSYKVENDSSIRTDVTSKTDDSESQAAPPDDDTSRSEREKSTAPQRVETPKVKKKKRFSLTFKKRERIRRDKKKETKNGVGKNGGTVHIENDSERLIDPVSQTQEHKQKHCVRHKPRNTLSSSSSGRFKRDSYQEMTTSHSEHERTNSMCSSINSLGSVCTHKSRKLSEAPHDGAIPWCGCWGAGCV